MRELRRDLHMRPFEGERRVYLVFGADSLNEDAADALLKDLEEPPPYAVIVLVAERLGPLPETIRSRCQLVPFRRLSEPAVRQAIREHAPDLAEEELTTLARVAEAAVPRVADRCIVELEEERLRGAPAVAAHIDPSKVPFVLEASRRHLPAEAYAEFEASSRALYKQMVRIVITPTWARLIDFERTAPEAVEKLMAERAAE